MAGVLLWVVSDWGGCWCDVVRVMLSCGVTSW